MKIKLSKGHKVTLSKVGHNGFFYPCEKSLSVLYDTAGDRLSWVGGGSKIPISIPENSVKISGSTDVFLPVWISYDK
jgi:hypothetical protein